MDSLHPKAKKEEKEEQEKTDKKPNELGLWATKQVRNKDLLTRNTRVISPKEHKEQKEKEKLNQFSTGRRRTQISLDLGKVQHT